MGVGPKRQRTWRGPTGRFRIAVLGLPAVFLAAFFFSLNASAGHAGETTPPLPGIGAVSDVDNTDVADPFVLTVSPMRSSSPTYYRYGTTDWQSNVPTAISTDLVHWIGVPDAMPNLPSWAAPSISMTWAPGARRQRPLPHVCHDRGGQ